MSIRIGTEALEAAKIAAAYKGMTVMDYVTGIILQRANRDIEEAHRARSSAGSGPQSANPPRPRRKGDRGGE